MKNSETISVPSTFSQIRAEQVADSPRPLAADANLVKNDSWPAVSIWEGGALSGVISGLVLGIILMLYYASHGEGFTFPLKLIAASIFGVNALMGGVGCVAVGLIIHLAGSAALGVLFAFLTQKVFSAETSLSVGILFGFCTWLAMTYVMLPWLDPVMKARADMASGWWFGCFMVYGMFLVLTPYFELKTAPRHFLGIARRRIMSESY